MSYIQDIKSLEHQHYLLAGLFFAATLAPGFLIIFHFKPELVEKYDFFKLLLFSMSFTVPYLLIHASQMAASGVFAGLGERDLKAGLGMACFASSHVLLVALLLTYFFGHSFKMFLINIAVLTPVSFVLFWLSARTERKKKANLADADVG
ncbi:hypothetical protein C1896_07795 [Pseudomonadaceae bacterium SI-3]|nr:hypothetical protein C1896_07795 [Pseudomonadaceae bacterium SI-3]